MLDKEEIKKIIPQREPFLMIDEVEVLEPGKCAVCYKNVDENEYYFQGHFPGNPVMPGVLITESLAQAGAVAGAAGAEALLRQLSPEQAP